MKNLKKLLAVLLAAALCLSLAACYNENNTWAAKDDDETLPIGSYIYFLNNAFTEARSEVSSDTEVAKATIDGSAAKDWIQNRAVDYVKAYFYLKSQLKAADKALTEEELSDASSTTDYLWTYYKAQMEEMGVAKSSLDKAYSVYGAMYAKYFDVLYGEDGQQAVSEEEIHKYYDENYYYYDTFYAPLTTTDDDGNSVDLSDDEKTKLQSDLEAAAKEILAGEDMATVAEKFAKDHEGEDASSHYAAATSGAKDTINATMAEALGQHQEGDVFVVQVSGSSYVVRKLSLADGFTAAKETESTIDSIRHALKDEEYEELVRTNGHDFTGCTVNTAALGTVDWGKFVTDDNKMGTKTAESSEAAESSESSESSTAE